MKQRFSSLDVKVISHELAKSLVSLRVANIYDLSSRIFLFKLAKPGRREQLLVDSGFRCHLTGFTRTTAGAPSAFVTRLRKYLKSRRITSVTQIGTDRIIEIEFSDGQYRLFLEFFAAGNIVLTDKDFNVLALFRQVSEGNEDVDVRLGSQYSLKAKQNYDGIPPLTRDRVKEALSSHIQKAAQIADGGAKKGKRKGGDELRKALSTGFPEYPAHLLDHSFRTTTFDPLVKPEQVLEDEELLSKLMTAIEAADKTSHSLDATDQVKGYIIAKTKDSSSKAETAEAPIEADLVRSNLLYDDYHPFRPSQFEDKPGVTMLEFDGFNKTVDEFYSSIESQKLESRLTEREENARRKIETAKQDHEKRLGALQQVQELHIRKAQAIEANTHRVEEAVAAVNGLIGQGMDWMDIAKLIENEQSRQNAVAQMIKLPLKLYENTVTLFLDEASFQDEEDEEDGGYETEDDIVSDEEVEESKKPAANSKTVGDKRLAVDIDLALSSWANARQYYDQKKTAAVKEQKTIQASTKALKSTERKITADLKKGLKQEKETLRPARKQFWFEKFIYFISSDGYLVLGGKDAQQNEMLYRRYLKKGDVYVHADLQGAASVIVKNMMSTPDAPIPPSTLSQAGSLSVCTSSAWGSKAVMAAWWVNADQVSKTAPTGEYLTTGGFTIRGKKNFLPPSQLLLGFAVMFQISEDSKAHHNKHRLQSPQDLTSETSDMENVTKEVQDLSVDDHTGDAAGTADGVTSAGGLEDKHGIPEEEGQANSEPEDESSDEEGPSALASENGGKSSNPLQPNGRESQPNSQDDNDNELQEGALTTQEPSEDEEPASEAEEPELEPEPEPETFSKDPNPPKATSDPPTNPPSPPPSSTSNPPAKPTPRQAPRGKRTKAKKAAKKYAYQDEQDRLLAMQLLGSQKAAEKKESAILDKAARDAKIAVDKERRRAQHERAANAERVRQERLAAGEGGDRAGEGEGDVVDVDAEVLEQEKLELANLDSLVGTPAPGDEILAALPVVAPWSALTKCKYKVKLQPGSVKKGKAVREMVGRWVEVGKMGPKIVDERGMDRERVWPREVEVIRQWRVEEVIGVVPVGKVRVVQSGGGGTGGGGGKGKGGSGDSSRGGRGSKKVR